METYIDEGYCDICDDITEQEYHDSGHERDSSNDWRVCLKCGATYSGFTGDWTPKEEEY